MATSRKLVPSPEPSVPPLRLADVPPPAMSPAHLPERREPCLRGLFVVAGIALFAASLLSPIAGLVLAGVLLLGGLVVGARSALRLRDLARAPEPVSAGQWAREIAVLAFGPILGAAGAGLAVLATMSFGRGRQLRRRGRILLPAISDGTDWTSLDVPASPPDDVRLALAAQWRENGRTEHASVAAFARLTLDLVALGAPPRLIAGAQRDALDEIRHAELCFGLARSLDGRERGPASFPEARRARSLSRFRPVALVRLAVDSLVDGALHEGLSARVLAVLARRCDDPAMRAMLREIASDEGRHSAHGWEVVEWCLAEGGAPVAHALRGAVAGLPREPATTLPRASRDGSWERHGIPGQALEAEHYREAREHVARRVAELCDARRVA